MTRVALLLGVLASIVSCKNDPPAPTEDSSTPDTGVDAGPTDFVLLTRSPDNGTDHAFVGDPISLEFSSAIDPDTFTDANVTVESSVDGELSIDLSVASDGTTGLIAISSSESLTTPATWTVSLTDAIEGLNGVALEEATWSYSLSSWSYAGAGPVLAGESRAPAVAMAEAGDIFVALLTERVGDGRDLQVFELVDGEWSQVGGNLNVNDEDWSATQVSIATDEESQPIVAWIEDDGSATNGYIKRWSGSEWTRLDDGDFAAASMMVAHGDENGTVAIAVLFPDTTTISFHTYDGDGLGPLTAQDYDGGSAIGGFDFSVLDGNPAIVRTGGDAALIEWDGDEWMNRGLPTFLTLVPDGASIARDSSGDPVIAWNSNGSVYVTEYAEGSFATVGHAVDVDARHETASPTIVVDDSDRPIVGFVEFPFARYYVGRWNESDSRWEFLGGAVHEEPSDWGAILLDGDSEPLSVIATGERTTNPIRRVHVHRWNRSATLAFGKATRGERGTVCVFPADDDPTFPTTLTATGCFTDVPARTLIDAAVPYDLTSQLWSDNASKERAILLPDGMTVTYAASGPMGFPVGTIFIKSFLYDYEEGDASTRFPMETRFLVKRCEIGDVACTTSTWQGYSYRWNEAGTEAELLPVVMGETHTSGHTLFEWDIEGGTHSHIYPSRAECTGCHNDTAGNILGIQAGELNRNYDYGGVVDHQLRVFAELGVFSGLPTDPIGEQASIPATQDVSFSVNDRARAYLNINCSHCHRETDPDGAGGMPSDRAEPWLPPWNFRYETPIDSYLGVCNDLTPGDSSVPFEVAYRVSFRPPAEMAPMFPQMPPIATNEVDPEGSALLAQWVTGLTAGDCTP